MLCARNLRRPRSPSRFSQWPLEKVATGAVGGRRRVHTNSGRRRKSHYSGKRSQYSGKPNLRTWFFDNVSLHKP